jgi:hypothetical protein
VIAFGLVVGHPVQFFIVGAWAKVVVRWKGGRAL